MKVVKEILKLFLIRDTRSTIWTTRAIVYGSGRSSRLSLQYVHMNADLIRILVAFHNHVLVTSVFL